MTYSNVRPKDERGRFIKIERTEEEQIAYDRALKRTQSAYKYRDSRKVNLEERLVKTRAKLKLLIKEAREYGMEHLLIEGE